ncbi:MAG: c-type cytochrome [Betaproteobacteria bacterium]
MFTHLRGVRTAGIALILAGALGVRMRAAQAGEPTPVQGPSTLHHLRLTIEKSSMGWNGQWSPPPTTVPPGFDGSLRSEPTGGPFVLSGADIYRISCRACHKADGTGAPPEINSIIGPVQAASVQWMTARMKQLGRPVDAAFIRQLTAGTEADLHKRFEAGGHNMPAFGYLSDAEIRVLRVYLDQLAGLSVPARVPTITEPSMRVGELLVKGTCHICHDATRADQPPTEVLTNVIPSLQSMTRQKTFDAFVHKVREGAPVPLGSGDVMSRGRMPVFNYLTEQEVAAAYAYLMAYPPR